MLELALALHAAEMAETKLFDSLPSAIRTTKFPMGGFEHIQLNAECTLANPGAIRKHREGCQQQGALNLMQLIKTMALTQHISQKIGHGMRHDIGPEAARSLIPEGTQDRRCKKQGLVK